MTTQTTILLLVLFFCHFLADYTHLSTAWMLNAKRMGKPLIPILAHAWVHATLMAITLMLFSVNEILCIKLFLYQWATHFVIDVWKGRMNGWFPALQNPANKSHWIIFGLDQFLHATVIIIMVQIASNHLK